MANLASTLGPQSSEPSFQQRSVSSNVSQQVEDRAQPSPASSKESQNIPQSSESDPSRGPDKQSSDSEGRPSSQSKPSQTSSVPRSLTRSSSKRSKKAKSGGSWLVSFARKRVMWIALLSALGPLMIPLLIVIIAVLATPIIMCYVGGDAISSDTFSGLCVETLSISP